MSVLPVEEILKYVNQARTAPKDFAQYVKEEIALFTSETQMPLYPGLNYRVNESKKTWLDCVDFLTKQKPLPPYEISKALNTIAEDHATDLVLHDMFGHVSSDGSDVTARLKKRCGTRGTGYLAENVGSDFKIKGRNHALKTVLGLIIDDGVPDRGHRDNIFSPNMNYIGMCAKVQNDKIITVMNFHSQDLPLKNMESVSKPGVGTELKYNEVEKKPKGFTDMKNFMQGSEKPIAPSKGSKYAVSKSTSTSTSVVNGRKKVTTVEKVKYNDGSEEITEKIEES